MDMMERMFLREHTSPLTLTTIGMVLFLPSFRAKMHGRSTSPALCSPKSTSTTPTSHGSCPMILAPLGTQVTTMEFTEFGPGILTVTSKSSSHNSQVAEKLLFQETVNWTIYADVSLSTVLAAIDSLAQTSTFLATA
jgi:hypothetical protein